MSWYDSARKFVASKLSSPVGGAVKAAGAVTGNKKLSNIGGAIQNPQLNYTGSFNPANMYANYKQPGGSFVAARSAASTGGNNTQDTTPQSLYGNGSGDGSGGGGSSTTDPMAELYGGQRQSVQNKLSSLINAYNTLTGSAEQAYKTQAENLRKDYGRQRQKVGDLYQQTANTLTGAYQAKGLGDSSFSANAQNSALNNYNTGLSDVNQAETTGLSKIGQALQTARGQYEAAKSTYQDYLNNLGNYGGQDLSNIMGAAETGLQNAATTQAGMGSQADYINAINSVAPVQVSPTALQTQLQTLQNSGTTDFVKSQMAKGLINQATGGNPEQQSYWTDYFNTLKTTGKA